MRHMVNAPASSWRLEANGGTGGGGGGNNAGGANRRSLSAARLGETGGAGTSRLSPRATRAV